MIQVRFEDDKAATTVYGLWDDDETPDVVTVLASLPDVFRARAGAPARDPRWSAAIEACRAAEAEMPGAPLPERHAAALRRFLAAGGMAPEGSLSVAGLLVAFDAHYFRPYSDAGQTPEDEHGVGSGPHVVVRVTREDHGHGPETVLAIEPDPELARWFEPNCPPGYDGDLGGLWYGDGELDLDHRIRASNPFSPSLTRVRMREGSTRWSRRASTRSRSP